MVKEKALKKFVLSLAKPKKSAPHNVRGAPIAFLN